MRVKRAKRVKKVKTSEGKLETSEAKKDEGRLRSGTD